MVRDRTCDAAEMDEDESGIKDRRLRDRLLSMLVARSEGRCKRLRSERCLLFEINRM